MGATRALVTIRLADGKMVYINERSLAEMNVKAMCDAGGAPSNGDGISQRLAVIEASLKVQHELAYDGKPLPCLHHAVQALRILNRAAGEAKHGFGDGRGHELVRSLGPASRPDMDKTGLVNAGPSVDGCTLPTSLSEKATCNLTIAADAAEHGCNGSLSQDKAANGDVHDIDQDGMKYGGGLDKAMCDLTNPPDSSVGPPPHDKAASGDVHDDASHSGIKEGCVERVPDARHLDEDWQKCGRTKRHSVGSKPVQRSRGPDSSFCGGGKTHVSDSTAIAERIAAIECTLVLSKISPEEELALLQELQGLKRSRAK